MWGCSGGADCGPSGAAVPGWAAGLWAGYQGPEHAQADQLYSKV